MKPKRASIQQIKAQIRLETIMRRRGIALMPSGTDRLMAHCPFHADEHPSLAVYPRTQRYYCFGCGAKGDLLNFVQGMEHCSLREALDQLANEAMPGEAESGPVQRDKPAMQSAQQHAGLPTAQEVIGLLTQAQHYYQQTLFDSDAALHYLATRGLSQATASTYRLGYVNGTLLVQEMTREPSWRAVAQRIGLLTTKQRERLLGRLIIPEWRGDGCHWMIGRAIPLEAERVPHTPKYLGLSWSRPLLGYGRAQARLRDIGETEPLLALLVVEGAIDVLLLWQWQLPVLGVALLGAHASQVQLTELVALHRQVPCLPLVVALDDDEAGKQGTQQLIAQVRSLGQEMWEMPALPGVNDLGELGLYPDGRARFLAQLCDVLRRETAQ